MGEAVKRRLLYIYIHDVANDRVTHSWCEVTAVTRRIVDSREMTRSSEDVHFIVVSTTQSLTTALLTIEQ